MYFFSILGATKIRKEFTLANILYKKLLKNSVSSNCFCVLLNSNPKIVFIFAFIKITISLLRYFSYF